MSILDKLEVIDFKPEINISGFSCGRYNIDNIFKNFTSVLYREQKATTNLFYIDNTLVGFCTLLADRISRSPTTKVFLGGDYPHYYPAVQLYCLGVQKEYQHMGIGGYILDWVISSVYEMRKRIGVCFIVLEALNDSNLIRFYENKGFQKWKFLDQYDHDLVPMVYDFRNLDV